MRISLVALLLAASLGSSIAAQSWTTQIGLMGGVSRQKPAGTGTPDQIDRWELPNTGEIHPALFVIVPLTRRVALESSLGASRAKFAEASGQIPAVSQSDIRLTGRADIALGTHWYVAGGALVRRREIDGGHSTQTGLVAAAGYRWAIGRGLDARIEAQWLTQRQSDSILPSNVYGLLMGISQRLPTGGAIASHAASVTPWRLQVGVAGGYARDHIYGSELGVYFDVRETVLDLPGSHEGSPPPLFLDVPLHGRLALEIGLGAQRIRQHDSTSFQGHIAPRLNIGLYRGLYAGAGGNVLYFAGTGSKGFALAGVNVAAGYRISLLRALEGRIDLTYTAFKERADFPFAQNVVGLLLGVAVPLR